MTQIGKYREILVVYCSAREAGLLIYQDLHQDLSEYQDKGKSQRKL